MIAGSQPGDDPFSILGVGPDIDDAGLRKAFRAMARSVHPDTNPNDPAAAAKFSKVMAAYERLRDPEQRRMARASTPSAGSREVASGFDDFFSHADRVGRGGSVHMASGRRPSRSPLFHQLALTLEQAFAGGRHVIQQAHGDCPICQGDGRIKSLRLSPCPDCAGAGSNHRTSGMITAEVECPTCQGRGRGYLVACQACGGEGKALGVALEIDVPEGCRDGYSVRLRREGASPVVPEDLVEVVVLDHDRFERVDEHLEMDLGVPLSAAALGGKTRIQGIDGRMLSVEVSPGSQTGDVVVLAQEGMPAFSGRGELRVRLKVRTPDIATPGVEDLMKELRRLGA